MAMMVGQTRWVVKRLVSVAVHYCAPRAKLAWDTAGDAGRAIKKCIRDSVTLAAINFFHRFCG